jgi:hypothetical protein
MVSGTIFKDKGYYREQIYKDLALIDLRIFIILNNKKSKDKTALVLLLSQLNIIDEKFPKVGKIIVFR